MTSGFTNRVRSAEQAYLFAHTVLREATYQLHLPAQRAELHSRAFEIIEAGAKTLGEGALDAVARELADHASAALLHGLQPAARRAALSQAEYTYLARAAKVALARYRNEEALTLLTRLADLELAPPAERADTLRKAGGLCIQASRFEQAERLLSAAEKLWRALEDVKGLARCRFSQAKLYGELLRSEDGKAAYSEAFDLSRAAQAPELTLEVHCARAVWLRDIGQAGDDDVALAQELAKKTDSLEARIDALHLQASRSQDEGKLDLADRFWNDALKLAEKTGSPVRIARILGSLAGNLFHGGKLREAENAYTRSLEVFRATGMYFNVPGMLGNLATIMLRDGRLLGAQRCYREAIDLAQELGLRKGLATLYSNLAAVHQFLGDDRQAEQEYRFAIQSAQAASDMVSRGIGLSNLGGICHSQGRHSEALAQYAAALEVLGTAALLPRSNALAGLAQVLISLGRFDEAEAKSREAQQIAVTSRVPLLEAMALGNLAHLALLRGYARESAKLSAQAVTLLDASGSQLSAQHTVMLTQLRSTLELEGAGKPAQAIKEEIRRRAPRGLPPGSVFSKAALQAEQLWQGAHEKRLLRGHLASELTLPQRRELLNRATKEELAALGRENPDKLRWLTEGLA